jgi:hypothetical protein
VKQTLAITLGVTLLLLGILALVGTPARWPVPEHPPRQGEAVSSDRPLRHSEQALTRLVREPQNTWSNLAFVIGGAWLVARGLRPTGRMLGWLLVGVGIGSFFYHASAANRLRHLDVGAMYWLYLVAALFCVATWSERFRHWLERRVASVALWTGAIAALLVAGRNVRMLGFKPFTIEIATGLAATLLVVALATTVRNARSRAVTMRGVLALGLFGLAVLCQVGDRPGGIFFSPDHAIQSHAVWHVLVAAAFVIVVHTIERGTSPPAA